MNVQSDAWIAINYSDNQGTGKIAKLPKHDI